MCVPLFSKPFINTLEFVSQFYLKTKIKHNREWLYSLGTRIIILAL